MIKRFQLGAKKYRVRYLNTNPTTNLGNALAPVCTIDIQKHWDGRDVPALSQEQTLFHEATHCILSEIGREDLSNDESFVQSFSMLFHQFIRTAK